MFAINGNVLSNLSLKSSASKIGISLSLAIGLLVPTNAHANESSTPVEANRNPISVVFTADGRYAYVSNNQASSNNPLIVSPGFLTRIDNSDNSLSPNIPILADPSSALFKWASAPSVALDPTGSFAYMTDSYNKFVVIDLATNQIISTFAAINDLDTGGVDRVGGTNNIVFSPTKNLAFITTRRSITIVNTQTHQVVGSIDLQREGVNVVDPEKSNPTDLAISNDGNTLFVTENSRPTETLQIFDITSLTASSTTASLIRAIPIRLADTAILITNSKVLVTNDLSTAYISTGYTRTLLKMNLTTGDLTELPVGLGVKGMSITSDNKTLITANSGENTATIIDLTGRESNRTVNVGVEPIDVAIAPNGRYAYVTNAGSSTLGLSKVNLILTPDAPRLVTGSSDQPTSVTLNFSPPTLNGEPVLSYEYSGDGGVTWLPVAPTVTSPPITISGLNPGVTYRFRIRALSQSGAGPSSDEVTVSTVSLIHTLPGVPVKLKKGKSFTVGVKSSAGSFVTTTSVTNKVCSVTKTTKMVKQAGKKKKVKVTTGYKIKTKKLGTCAIKSSAPAIGYYPATQSISTLQVTKK